MTGMTAVYRFMGSALYNGGAIPIDKGVNSNSKNHAQLYEIALSQDLLWLSSFPYIAPSTKNALVCLSSHHLFTWWTIQHLAFKFCLNNVDEHTCNNWMLLEMHKAIGKKHLNIRVSNWHTVSSFCLIVLLCLWGFMKGNVSKIL